ncbi:MAG: hypothetical protein IPL53_07920 [Ignavibacteria bacterium]|nr:hypothetical protein [Ignavibacteria bacterium]
MSANKSASLEARIKNSRDLVVAVSGYALYNPTNEKIKSQTFGTYVDDVESKMTEFRDANGALTNASKDNSNIFSRLRKLSRDVRFEVGELKGTNSAEYSQVNSVVRLITGENNADHTRMKKKILSAVKDGDPKPDFSSVSALDYKSQLGNFKALIGLVKNYDFYAPEENSITIKSLEAFGTEVSNSLLNIALKETTLTNARSSIIHLFEDEHGLKDRARKAKMHVKRKYGIGSPEYKALVNKIY